MLSSASPDALGQPSVSRALLYLIEIPLFGSRPITHSSAPLSYWNDASRAPKTTWVPTWGWARVIASKPVRSMRA